MALILHIILIGISAKDSAYEEHVAVKALGIYDFVSVVGSRLEIATTPTMR